MSDASASNRFTERLRDAFAERKIAMTAPLTNKRLGSGFRVLGEGYEVRVIYRPEGPSYFALEIHSCAESKADDERPDYKLTASRPNRQ